MWGVAGSAEKESGIAFQNQCWLWTRNLRAGICKCWSAMVPGPGLICRLFETGLLTRQELKLRVKCSRKIYSNWTE